MKYWNGSSWESIVPGKFSEQLTLCQGNIPRWGPCPGIPVVDIDRNSYYMSKNKVKLLFSAFDPARRDTLIEVGVIYGKKPDVSLKDGVLKLPVNKTGDFYSIELDILNDKSLTYVKVYAKNIAGITFSQELNLLGLSHKISDFVLIPDSSPFGSLVDWVTYDYKTDKIYYKTSFNETEKRKSSIYTSDENKEISTLSYEYELPISNSGYSFQDDVSKNEYCFIDSNIHLFYFTDWPETLLQKRTLKKSQNNILSLLSNKTVSTEFTGMDFKVHKYIAQKGNNFYLLGNLFEDYPFISLGNLASNDSINKIKTLDIQFPEYGAGFDWEIIDSTIIMFYDRDRNGGWPSLRTYGLNGNLINSVEYQREYLYKPFTFCQGTNTVFLIDWAYGELKQYDNQLLNIKTFKLPSLINVDLNSDNNCIIIQKSGYIRLFLNDRNNRLLSFDLYQ